MPDSRPNPDQLLARVRADDERARRGKLRIFFGYAAGIGKTYQMLSAARRERDAGVDVVVGYVEPHGRAETEALLSGLESIPTRSVSYRGVTVREFDLDATLARRPRLALVDELAHTNAEGSRHAKRWQDVEELLAAGIDVWTTLNVQHVESLNDVIAQITGVVVRETLPDVVLERADEIEIIDLTPEELVARLQSGKVYLPAQAERALLSFFQKSNLVALRELALRQAARRLHQDVEAARQARSPVEPWATNERLLVCVGPSPSSAKIIRTAKRMAAAFGADWLAVAVAAGGEGPAALASRELTSRNLRLAERLGAATHTLIGRNIAETVIEFAQSNNVTKIIAGKSALPWWRRAVRRTVVEELLKHSGEIDVYVISGEGERAAGSGHVAVRETRPPYRQYAAALAVVVACGVLAWLSQHLLSWPEANTAMIFLAGVALMATRFGRAAALATLVLSVIVVDLFFVLPYGTFAVSDARYLPTFGVMIGIGVLISVLAARQRSQLRVSQEQERRTAKLFRMTRQLSELSGTDFLLQTTGKQLSEFFGGEVVVYLREDNGALSLRIGEGTAIAMHPINPSVAHWVADHDQMAGLDTDTLPNATALFVPLVGSQRTIGVVGVRPEIAGTFRDPDQRRLLETCASLIALALERDQSVLAAQEVQVEVEAEKLRNSLFSSVSHDLRTPMTAIAGTAASLLEELSAKVGLRQQEMLQTLVTESYRLVRFVENLLDMAKLEAGAVVIKRQWHVLEELVGSAISRLRRELANHEIRVDIPESFPLIFVDGLLLEQVFVNVLENASRYTPHGAAIEITAAVRGNEVEITFADEGPGLPHGSEEKVFDKFFHAPAATADGRRGVGLGLAICRGIVEAHGGQMTARNRPRGGAEFVLRVPCEMQSQESAIQQNLASS